VNVSVGNHGDAGWAAQSSGGAGILRQIPEGNQTQWPTSSVTEKTKTGKLAGRDLQGDFSQRYTPGPPATSRDDDSARRESRGVTVAYNVSGKQGAVHHNPWCEASRKAERGEYARSV